MTIEEKKQDARTRKCPCIEHRGVWTVLERWPLAEYTALRWTLLKFNTHGEELNQQMLWLYNKFLNLPLKYQEDVDIIVQSIKNHDAHRREFFPSHPETWVQTEISPELVGNIYAEEITKVLNTQETR